LLPAPDRIGMSSSAQSFRLGAFLPFFGEGRKPPSPERTNL
jgi:hypothetical protein